MKFTRALSLSILAAAILALASPLAFGQHGLGRSHDGGGRDGAGGSTGLGSGASYGPASPMNERMGATWQRDPSNPFDMDKIAEYDYKRALGEATRLQQMITKLKDDLQKGDAHILSAASLKQAEEIEKLARKLRSHLHSQ